MNINSNRITIVVFVFVLVVLIIRVLVLKLRIQIMPFRGSVGWGGSIVFQLNNGRRVSWLFLLRFFIAIFTCLLWIRLFANKWVFLIYT